MNLTVRWFKGLRAFLTHEIYALRTTWFWQSIFSALHKKMHTFCRKPVSDILQTRTEMVVKRVFLPEEHAWTTFYEHFYTIKNRQLTRTLKYGLDLEWIVWKICTYCFDMANAKNWDCSERICLLTSVQVFSDIYSIQDRDDFNWDTVSVSPLELLHRAQPRSFIS